MGFSKRSSGPPRRPRNPVAKNVRTPLYKPRVEQDKRWREQVKQEERLPPEEAEEMVDKPDEEATDA
jgi:hypothetical protein